MFCDVLVSFHTSLLVTMRSISSFYSAMGSLSSFYNAMRSLSSFDDAMRSLSSTVRSLSSEMGCGDGYHRSAYKFSAESIWIPVVREIRSI